MSLFLLHVHKQFCSGCGKVEELSSLYLPEAEGAATRLRPFRAPLPPDAVVSVTHVPATHTHVCIACLPSDELSQKRASEAAQRWAETIRRKRGEALLPSETSRFQTSKGRAPAQPRPIEDLA